MAEGSSTYKGLAVPLFGESEIKQVTAANDILSVTGVSAQTGDYLVLQDSSGVEDFVFNKDGTLVLGKTSQAAFSKLRLPILSTAPTSAAGIAKGDVWLAQATADVYRLAVAISDSVATAVRYGGRITRATLGSASH